MRSYRVYLLLLIIILVSGACTTQQNGTTALPTGLNATEHSTETSPAGETPVPSPLSTTVPATPSAAPSATTPAATLAGTGCSAGQNQPALDVSDFDQYPQAIQDFLNNGGTPSDLDEALYNAGVANQPVAVKTADMTGDGQAEVVVSIFDPASPLMPPSGKLMIYTCQEGAYQLAYQEDSAEAWGAPGIRDLQDLNADGKAELLTSEGSCGAHTCFEDVKVIAWDGEGFANLFEGSSKEIPYPDIRVTDDNGDGVFDIEVRGSGYGSVGAGPQRNVIDIWKYDSSSGSWKFDKEVLQDSNYRIHVLHDAETEAKNGDYTGALELYDRVINDSSLDDWMDPETERANLSAYALFKTGVIYTIEGQQDQANAAFEQLKNSYPEGVPQHAYVEMADAYQQAYANSGLEAACAAARNYASEHADQILAPLGPQAFGYANREFTPDDVCPE